jgi:signal transduction histidine kinase
LNVIRRRHAPASVEASRPIAWVAVAATALTLFVIVNHDVRFAYDNLSLHVALETGEGLIAGLLAYLAVERFRVSGLLRDVLLAWTFSVLGVTNLLLCAVPMVSLGARPVGTLTWLVAGLRLAGAVGLCAAAFAPVGAPLSPTSRVAVTRIGGALVVLFAVASVAADAWLGNAVDTTMSPQSSDRVRLVAHPIVLGLQVFGVALYGAAAMGFRRQARETEDQLLSWLAAGAVLAAFARVHFFLFPSLYSDWVYTGDLLRLGGYLCFLAGAARQIDAYRRQQTRVAVLDERRRVARELHDGVVQELAFIRSHTAAIAGDTTSPAMVWHISTAAERALAECRHAIEALTSAGADRESLLARLQRAADDVAVRAGTRVVASEGSPAEVSHEVQAALERVVREAATNAVAHGGATLVTIDVKAEGDVLRVAISDDGVGFDMAEPTTGFGLRSMRERLEGVGGVLVVRSAPGEGTVVEATVSLSGRSRRWRRR